MGKSMKAFWKWFVLAAVLMAGVAFVVSGCSHNKNKDWIMIQHNDDSGSQGMFYTFYKEAADTLIVIDGGNPENAEHVKEVIHSYGGHVNDWILTHYHRDHAGAFDMIMKDPGEITVDRIYASPMDYDEYLSVAQEWDDPQWFTDFLSVTKDREITYLNEGDEFQIGDLDIKVYHSYDKDIGTMYGDIPNNASLVFKVTGKKDSVLFCADCRTPALGEALMAKWGDELKAEYVQLGHHGNWGLSADFYDFVGAKAAFFDGPEWLMTGETYDAKDLKKHFDEVGVTTYDMRTTPNQFVIK